MSVETQDLLVQMAEHRHSLPSSGRPCPGAGSSLPPRCPWMGLEEVQSGSWCGHVYPGCWAQEVQKNAFLTILLLSQPPSKHWGRMRRIGRGWAPKMGLAPLCFLEGGGCQGNGGDRCPSPTPLHLLLILSALSANVAPRSYRVNRPAVSTYYAPDTSHTEQSPFSWGS